MKISRLVILLFVILYCCKAAHAQTVTLKPNAANGQDVCIATSYGCRPSGSTSPWEVLSNGNGTELVYMDWTYNAGGCPHGTHRILLKFDALSTLVPGAVIANATLKLYGVPTTSSYGNSSHPGSPYGTTNEGWVRRVTGSWAENTVTWNTQPSTTTVNQVATPVSTSQFSWNMSVNVTGIIRDIISSGTNNGMMLVLQNEAIYRASFFASSDHPDSTLWPELVVEIVNPKITTDSIPGPLCAGAAINIPYTAVGIFNSTNIFTAQLSDASGSFASPVTIGTLASTASTGIIPGIIPATTPPGSSYRVRVISSDQPITGLPNTTNLTIQAKPSQPGPITGDTLVCTGSSQLYSVPAVPGATSYTWTIPTGWTGSSTTTSVNTIAGISGGIISVTANNACGSSLPATRPVTTTSSGIFIPSVSIATDSQLCAGKPLRLTAIPVNGGSAAAYQWMKNGGNVGTNTTTYTDPAPRTGDVYIVTMAAGGLCIAAGIAAADTIKAIVHPSVIPGININSNPPHILCEGTAIRFIANITGGGPAPQYQWYKNGMLLTGVTADSFLNPMPVQGDTVQAVLISSAVCPVTPRTYSNKMSVNVAPWVTPSVIIHASPGTVITHGQWTTFDAIVTHGGSTPSYQWIRNGTWIPGATGTSYTSNTLNAGDIIRVQVNSSAPCAQPPVVSSNQLQMQPAVGVSETSKQGHFRLFPNPNNGQFTVAVNQGHATQAALEIVNMLGQTIYKQAVRKGSGEWSVNISLGYIASGIYLLKLVSGDDVSTMRFEVYK